jgi:hypothetical protein
MKTLDVEALVTVTGGLTTPPTVSGRTTDQQTQLLLTQMQSDLKEAARSAQDNKSQQMTTLLTAVMASKLAQR